ncbi:MAG: hypothetical protein ACK5KT_17560 [Dysgonomonas sp.]
MKKTFLIFISFVLSLPTVAQEEFRIMFYNVENLFDTKDNRDTNDDDLTPDGQLHWTNYRYWKKQNDISKVISSVGGKLPPAIVGLCEVENDSVLFDLIRRTGLNRHKYEYIITDSKDSRGSNIGLLYQRDQMKVIDWKSYTPHIEAARTTRDILHVVGRVVNGETLDVFVCHFPSRNEGIKKTRPYRVACAGLLKQKTDSLFKIRKRANIIIMGDFNDYPSDVSLRDTLSAYPIQEKTDSKSLYNLFYHKSQVKNIDIASYKYRGKWNYIDQFIVSGNLLSNRGEVFIKNREAYVYSADFLLQEDNKKYSGQKPYRTYSGWKYLGGFSDHMPIYINLEIKP